MNEYKCEHCDQSFANGSNLRRHRRTFHLDKKTHECTQCSKKFARSDSLSRHIFRHNNQAEKYTCDVNGCKRAFTQLQKLEEHRSDHIRKLSEDIILIKGYTVSKVNEDESTTFVCPIGSCSKAYTSYAGIAKHITLHEEPERRFTFKSKVYTCEDCGKTFDKNKRLLVHKDVSNNLTHTSTLEIP
ncbi:c2h2 zinc finger domain containing protein [Theileria equi strain WA]|uniref:C2h2 zinc finger domain containing protein n=1 Tax=Theileria equi strain WA TaxID=1537102 RepID=L1LD47_THEEQ|nr:c2h2 zinc finger domain containing protein [Theileria equi strain WA]EKX73204.1 c2h2 zinc finger domain containing protein [Theileria equi strain WA]|eukprot:XP_004832656.1 c2h2 zinc finger domain containing protein [Theileria equi strain WA]